MRKLLVVIGLIVLALPLLAGPSAVAQTQGGGNPVGVLGPVNALGQEVNRPPAPTGPPPRLPDGTIDLGDGIWDYSPFGADIGQGLKQGEVLPVLPSAQVPEGRQRPRL